MTLYYYTFVTDILSYPPIYSDCKAALECGQTTSGIYKVQPDHIDPFYVSKSIVGLDKLCMQASK